VSESRQTYDSDMTKPGDSLFGTTYEPCEDAAWSEEAPQSIAKPSGLQPRPLQVTWEMTNACEWRGAHPRTSARSPRDRQLFSTAEAFHLVEQVAAMHVPLLALTGGDPLLRPDLFPVIEFATSHSVRTSLTLLPTPRLDATVIGELKACQLMRVGLWLNGSTGALHDACWAISGLHRRTLDLIGRCHEVQLPVQINTVVSRRNLHDFDSMVELLTRLDVALWNVFFFVPASREEAEQGLSAEEHEQIFARLYAASGRVHFQIKITEGQHYQRYVVQQRVRESRGRMTTADVIACSPRGVNEGRSYVFINHNGEVYPSRFLPVSGGNVTRQPLADIYRNSSLFISLRDSSRLKGKCGRCPVASLCGGSRARAYAMTGDLFAEEPCCAYQP
jgi:radical SAM protein with 4Fe4S-binding SPASM domain